MSTFAEPSVAHKRVLLMRSRLRGSAGPAPMTSRHVHGRSPVAVYLHHDSKEDLLFEISMQGHRDSLAVLEGVARSSDDLAESLWEMAFTFSHWHATNANLARVVQYELHSLSEDHLVQVVALRRRFQESIIDVLEAGGSADVSDLSATVRAVLSRCIDLVRWFDPGLQRSADRVARSNADLSLRMVGCRPGRRRVARRR